MSDHFSFIAIGADELREPLGKEAHCPRCGKRHSVCYGNDEAGKETQAIAFVRCGGNSYLVGLYGRAIAYAPNQRD